MKLSIVIVNYNVKYFLEQALLSVRKAAEGIESEVLVVDNASTDGSVALVQQRFPEVQLITNAENVGFSKANNQAIRKATGEYILLLNPDTVIEEDALIKCIEFLNDNPAAGALGVKMIDGSGKFLPESKRGLPTPRVAFFKMTGLSKLFPKSRTFNRYHAGHLDQNEIHEVDVLAGAFMIIRKQVLDKIGLLDEQFFMYGEDIDLSYRITQAGYKNFYYPKVRIIHYKGESTKKGSLNYVRMFYRAMIVFAEKHFTKGRARLYRTAILAGIRWRALTAGFGRILKVAWMPVFEAALLFGGIFILKNIYATKVKDAAEYYPEEYMYYIVPFYVLIWIGSIFFSGGYDRPLRISKAVRGVFIGTVLIAAAYGFVDESLRYSRAMIILGAGWAGLLTILFRALLMMIRNRSLRINPSRTGRLAIVGDEEEGNRVLGMLNQARADYNYIGMIEPNSDVRSSGVETSSLGTISQLGTLTDIYALDEVILCSKNVSTALAIDQMTKGNSQVRYKLVPENGLGIIGSNSKNTAGDLLADDANLEIARPGNRRNKRLFDLIVCVALLALLPVTVIVVRNRGGLAKNWLHVLVGRRTWVGFAPTGGGEAVLPILKKGVLDQSTALPNSMRIPQTLSRLNLLYAKDYNVMRDLRIVWDQVRSLGAD